MLFFPFRKHSTYRLNIDQNCWRNSHRLEPTSRRRPKVTRSASNCSRWSPCTSSLIHGKAPESYHADERSPISDMCQIYPLHQAQCRKAGQLVQRADGTRPVALPACMLGIIRIRRQGYPVHVDLETFSGSLILF